MVLLHHCLVLSNAAVGLLVEILPHFNQLVVVCPPISLVLVISVLPVLLLGVHEVPKLVDPPQDLVAYGIKQFLLIRGVFPQFLEDLEQQAESVDLNDEDVVVLVDGQFGHRLLTFVRGHSRVDPGDWLRFVLVEGLSVSHLPQSLRPVFLRRRRRSRGGNNRHIHGALLDGLVRVVLVPLLEIGQRHPGLLVDVKTLLDELPGLRGEFECLAELDGQADHLIDEFLLSPALPRSLPMQQLEDHDADRPDVVLGGVDVLLQGLGRHVERTTHVVLLPLETTAALITLY